jgi:hypothetical protein
MAFTAQNCVDALCPPLRAANAAALYGWADTDLFAALSRAAEELARAAAVWGGMAAVTITARNSSITLPSATRRLVGIHAAGIFLKETTRAALEGLGEGWQSYPAEAPTHYSWDALTPGAALLYPVPWTAPSAGAAYLGSGGEFNSSADSLTAPEAIQEIIEMGAFVLLHESGREPADARVASQVRPVWDAMLAAAGQLWGAL